MTWDKTKFFSLKAKEGDFVTYEDNNKEKILGIGNIGKSLITFIENVLYVEGLKHNLLIISQLCDKGYKISFNKYCFTISNPISNEFKFVVIALGIPTCLMLIVQHHQIWLAWIIVMTIHGCDIEG